MTAEGKNKTETQYFKDLARTHNQNIRFTPGNETDPVHMAAALIKSYSELEMNEEFGDHGFCLVDTDVNPKKNEQLAKADVILKRKGLQMIVSSPCFEVWCLCHFGNNSKHYISSDAVVEELSKKLPEYRKSGEGLYEKLSPCTDKAIRNARFMERACMAAGYNPHTVEFSPATEVYQVVEIILNSESAT